MATEPIILSLAQLLVTEDCPLAWQDHDLYLFRDEQVVFYVGQSRCAFERAWDHIRGGFKGRSPVGRFILVNWPRSLHFTVELLSSASARFAGVDHDLNGAEWLLIDQHAPCFNEALNRNPTPLPDGYLPPAAHTRMPRNLRHMTLAAAEANRRQRIHSRWQADPRAGAT